MGTIAETNRLIIRTWIPEQDAEQAFQIYSDPEVTRFLITKVDIVESSLTLLQRWVAKAILWNNGSGFWTIVTKETGEIIGMVGLIQLQDEEENLTQDYEIGWHLKKSFWSKGYAIEAAKAILDYGFKVLKLSTIYAISRPENTDRSVLSKG